RRTLARLRPGECGNVNIVARVNELLLLRRGGIDEHDRDLVASEVRRDVELAIVGGEELWRELIAKRCLQHRLERVLRTGAVEIRLVDAVRGDRVAKVAGMIGAPCGDV